MGWLAVHGFVGMLPIVGAVLLILARIRSHRSTSGVVHLNRNHRRYGRVLVVLWVFTHLGGFVNYYLFT